MKRNTCARRSALVLIALLVCTPAFAQQQPAGQPAGDEDDHIFGHPEWRHPNNAEKKVFMSGEDIPKFPDAYMRHGAILLAGKLTKAKRMAVRQDIVDYVLGQIITFFEGDHYFEVRKACPQAIVNICDRAAVAERIKYLNEQIKKAKLVQETPEEVTKAFEAQLRKGKKALLNGLKKDRKNEVRGQCAGFIIEMARDKEVVDALIEALLKDEWSIVRVMAIESLKKIKNPSCVPALRRALESDPYSTVRAAAAGALVEFGDKGSVKLFVKGLTDGWSNVRIACIRALVAFKSGGVTKPLLRRLSDRRYEVREEAANALGEIGDASALPQLERELKEVPGGEFETFRDTIYKSVAEIGKRLKPAAKQAADILADGLSDKLPSLKLVAIGGLLHLKDPRGPKALPRLLLEVTRAKHPWLQIKAISLAVEEEVKDADLLKMLLRLTKSEDTDPIVRQKAQEAYDKLK